MSFDLYSACPFEGIQVLGPQSDVNEGVLFDDSARSGPSVAPSRLSNLDVNSRLVKRGLAVSFHGLRYRVSSVRSGYCYCKPMSLSGRVSPFALLVMYRCESVQVVG